MIITSTQLPMGFKSNTENLNLGKASSKNDVEKAVAIASVPLFVGLTALSITKATAKSFEKIMKQKGLELKNGILVLSKNGETFSGKLKRRFGKLGIKKEVVEYENGILKEKLRYNCFGKETEGFFYKNGKLDTAVFTNGGNKNKFFGIHKYSDDGKIFSEGEGRVFGEESVFEHVRKGLK